MLGGSCSRVSTPILVGQWCLNNSNHPTNVRNQIQKINIFNSMVSDFWWWKSSHNGQFSIKSAWNNTCVHEPIQEIFQHVCVCVMGVNCPKIFMCLYLAALNRLNTLDKVNGWSNIQSMARKLCDNGDATINYLNFHCHYSKLIWKNIK